jgi:hypothetical protein
VHGRKQRAAKDTGNTSHVERVHEDIVLGLKDQHKVERSRDSEGHAITETTLTDGVGQEDSRGGGNRGGESNEDPRAHAETVGEFPLTTHVRGHSEQKVHDDQLVLAAIVQPFVDAGGFPNGVKVHANSVRRRDNSTRDDVVAVQQGSGHWFADAINVDRRRREEGRDEAGGSGQEGGEHQGAEPADVEAVLGAGDPVGELLWPYCRSSSCRPEPTSSRPTS